MSASFATKGTNVIIARWKNNYESCRDAFSMMSARVVPLLLQSANANKSRAINVLKTR